MAVVPPSLLLCQIWRVNDSPWIYLMSPAPANAKINKRTSLRQRLPATLKGADPHGVMPAASPPASTTWRKLPHPSSPASGRRDLLDLVVGRFYHLRVGSAAQKTSARTPSHCQHTSALAESPDHVPRKRVGLINCFDGKEHPAPCPSPLPAACRYNATKHHSIMVQSKGKIYLIVCVVVVQIVRAALNPRLTREAASCMPYVRT